MGEYDMKYIPNIKNIKDGTNVWVVHSGKNKKRFDIFANTNTVTLDMPGLVLSPDMDLLKEDIFSVILMSEAVNNWHKQNAKFIIEDLRWHKKNSENSDFEDEKPEPPAEPSRNPQVYPVPEKAKGRMRYKRTAIKRFLFEIKEGDLVIVPAKTVYDSFLVGFVQSSENSIGSSFIKGFGEDRFPTREVKWLPHKVTKRGLSDGLSKLLEQRQAVTKVDLGIHAPELFSAIFGAYTYKGTAGFDIDCPNYRGRNPLETIPILELTAFYVALWHIIQDDPSQLSGLSFKDIIDGHYEEELVLSLGNEFHSPGYARTIFCSIPLLYFSLAGMAMALNGCAEVESLEISSGSASGNISDEEINKYLEPMIKHMTQNLKEAVNKKGKQAREELGASVVSELVKSNKDSINE